MSPNQPPVRNNALLSCLGVFVILFSFVAGIGGSFIGAYIVKLNPQLAGDSSSLPPATVKIEESSAVIDVVDKSINSVVSIIIQKELPNINRFYFDDVAESTLQQVGSGSGFVISSDGLILTNRHVASEEDAQYTVVLNDGTDLVATVLARDTILDIAILKVEPGEIELTPLPLGDSDSLDVGQTVIAIGNALGEFSNSVSLGIVSGLQRNIIAGDDFGGSAEELGDVIQTDASINPGNSGGPLLDIVGNVVGVNVAVAQDAENIGFAIPINSVKRVIESVEKFGEIRRPYLGVRYVMVTKLIQEEQDLPIDFGALIIVGNNGEPGVIDDSPAKKAGLRAGDIITKIDEQRIDEDHPLQNEIQKYEVGDQVVVEYQRGDEVKTVNVILEKAE